MIKVRIAQASHGCEGRGRPKRMGKCGTVGKAIAVAMPVLLGIAVYLHERDPAYLAVLYRIPGMKELARSSHRVLSLR